MFPKIQKQAGNLYIVAIFVLVVMGFLASALTRLEWSNHDALSRDLLGTKAWFAAHSSNELALTLVYPLSRSSAFSSLCPSETGAVSSISEAEALINQYEGCRGTSQCQFLGELNNQKLYKLESRVICGSEQYQVERVQDIVVKE
ncbi:MSHA biogenesis protein MshP [Vibrio cincinnatiensis]|jgi:MSHA biogenesis protein MshP|uniref:MSHA biogenesis protein MshP n=1 Tax=Vibrio cincinnatiensis DSM 19608 TaxID=1123491 RepID=A0A1T4QH73_VIBCI|nr:MSHA biogenesis protein MshP [Vibrio cincinnatiensis]EKO3610543.1 MSHA biogenesis protein MshP [Vibrio metschnikovii]EKO3621590.1 MSHA biogenesis protein MshP [Vibrio metschnikovii]EKO3622634.1 MSHA biogenesis protein MshP [Vibrio metschnikovii]EKO3624716.1 MSHA biogenesis protein MshP [Vibrio metschnikovii]EKO3625901.1 MSHA biogenesis protein MshP [Vibrio metschnikovii]